MRRKIGHQSRHQAVVAEQNLRESKVVVVERDWRTRCRAASKNIPASAGWQVRAFSALVAVEGGDVACNVHGERWVPNLSATGVPVQNIW